MSEREIWENWSRVRLGDILQLPQETANPHSRPDEVFQYVDISSVNPDSNIVIEPKTILGREAPSRARKVIRENDVIFSTTRPYLKTLALVDKSLTGQICSTGFCVMRPKKAVYAEYLFYFAQTTSFLDQILPKMRGSNYPAVSDENIFDALIPLPSLSIQRAIVVILSKADMIRRKRALAREVATAALPALFEDIFGDPGINRRKFSMEPLGSLGDIVSGVTKGQTPRGNDIVEVPYLRVANVQDGYLDLSEVKTIQVSATDAERYRLQPDDLLLTEGGDPDKLGRGYIWKGEIDNCIHQNHIFRVRADQSKVQPLYLAGLIRTAYAKQYFLKSAKRTSNLASINMTQLKALAVPVPPSDLQELYVESAETLTSAISRSQQGVDSSNALFSSLLTRAFTGELTSEWEHEHEGLIDVETARINRRPQLALLALISARQQRRPEAVGITSLMKYVFLAQMQGQSFSQPAGQLYTFIPYHFGPFAQDIYTDLELLAAKEWLIIERPEGDLTVPERTDIRLNPDRTSEVAAAINELSVEERADLVAVIEEFGNLTHNELLNTVYQQYPAYARNSKLRRRRA